MIPALIFVLLLAWFIVARLEWLADQRAADRRFEDLRASFAELWIVPAPRTPALPAAELPPAERARKMETLRRLAGVKRPTSLDQIEDVRSVEIPTDL